METHNKSNISFITKIAFLLAMFSLSLHAASIADDTWLDQIVQFVKVNLEGNFAFLIILIGISIGFISALFGKWSMALTAFVAGILIGAIVYFAGLAQTMGQSFQ